MGMREHTQTTPPPRDRQTRGRRIRPPLGAATGGEALPPLLGCNKRHHPPRQQKPPSTSTKKGTINVCKKSAPDIKRSRFPSILPFVLYPTLLLWWWCLERWMMKDRTPRARGEGPVELRRGGRAAQGWRAAGRGGGCGAAWGPDTEPMGNAARSDGKRGNEDLFKPWWSKIYKKNGTVRQEME